MGKQYILKVYPPGHSREIYRTIQISGRDTLDELCNTVITSFDFIDEHLYEFCMDNRMYSEDSYQSDPEFDEPSTDIALDKLHLEKGQNFSLHYDFGDDWMFTIHVQKIEEVKQRKAPAVLKEKGSIEQYPYCEDWDDDEYYDE
jgi:hypothetical protein